jgi:hypothetical protein
MSWEKDDVRWLISAIAQGQIAQVIRFMQDNPGLPKPAARRCHHMLKSWRPPLESPGQKKQRSKLPTMLRSRFYEKPPQQVEVEG